MTERQKALRIKQLKEKRRRAWRRMAIGLRLLLGTIILLLVAWLLVGVTKRVRMNELSKQSAQLAHLEEDFAKYREQNETMEALIREFDEALAKYEQAPKSEQQKLLEQYEDEIINLNHEIEDQSLEAAEVKEKIAYYKKLLNISAREEVTLPEPETTEEVPTEPAEQPPVEQPPVEIPGDDGDFEHE